MHNDYTFLTDHSYSLRPVVDDEDDQLPLKKSKKSRQTLKTNNRKASIDRSSSDKENNSSSTKSRRARLLNRIAMSNTGKKSEQKSSSSKNVKLSITKKKKVNNRGKTKLSQVDSSDILPSLSIEERVKLRRTKPVQPSPMIIEKKSVCSSKSSKTSPVKTTKSFLGSGLDLDNIVLGNRQRRSART